MIWIGNLQIQHMHLRFTNSFTYIGVKVHNYRKVIICVNFSIRIHNFSPDRTRTKSVHVLLFKRFRKTLFLSDFNTFWTILIYVTCSRNVINAMVVGQIGMTGDIWLWVRPENYTLKFIRIIIASNTIITRFPVNK